MTEPLQKWLQRRGMGSKADVRTWITEGRVTLAGEVVRRFAEPVLAGAEVCLDGEPVGAGAARTVLAMHKPKKHLTTPDELGRYLPPSAPYLFPVGRLDFNTEGLLLWTNDGALGRAILHPTSHLPKVYRVKVRGHLTEDDPGLAAMREGMDLGDFTSRPSPTRIVVYRTRATWIEIVLTEGKFRQVRRMCRKAGYQIVKLRRESIGPIGLGELTPRCVRVLDTEEVRSLDAALASSNPDPQEP